MKIAISFRTKGGQIHVDCSECKRGGNGDGTCERGGQHKLGYRDICLKGEVLDNYKVLELKQQRSKSHGKKSQDLNFDYHKEDDFWS